MGLLTTTITDFRKDIKAYVDDVINEYKTIVIPRNKTGVVVMSLEEYNSIKETAYLLSNSANAERLQRSLADAKEGKLKERDLLE